ncbi:MAG: DUF6443 domain-containing protein [Ferruginibacter sp.]
MHYSIKKRSTLLLVFALLSVAGYSQITLTSGGGYLDKPTGLISTTIKKEAVTDATQITTLTASEQVQTLQYIDGFGRGIESIVKAGSPTGKDIINFTKYDEFGRVSKAYLPYEATTTSGLYIDPANAITAQASFYSTNTTANKIANDASPFSQTVYETSPLQRVLKQGGVGDGFQPTQHYKTVNYRSSTGSGTGEDKVLKWNSTGTTDGYYNANDLSVTEGTDEAGNIAWIFTDKLGRLILKRQQLTTNTYANTYYGYDYANNIMYIVPPKAIVKMGSSFDIANTPKLIYQFWYDTKNRVIQKKVPGAAGDVYMVYDPLDRMVLMQDGNMRYSGASNWLYFKYDNANRIIIQGMYNHGSVQTQAQMQAIVTGQACYDAGGSTPYAYFEVRQAATASGYSNRCFPTANTEERTYNYFDDYDFDFDGTDDYSKQNQGLTNEATATDLTYGLPTGSKTKILGSGTPGTWLTAISFYDKYYHTIQVRSNNQIKTAVTDHTTNVVNFEGQALEGKQVKTIGDPNGITNTLEIQVSTRYEYDDMGRLTKVKQTNAGASELTVAKYEYNPLGQLVDKKLHSTNGTNYLQSVDMRYNIRGQLTSVNNSTLTNDGVLNDETNDLFGMELLYDKEETGSANINNTGNFTGMLSAVKWKAASPANTDQRSFTYSYDKLYRLTAATYQAKATNNTWTKDAGGFNESLSYDENGNIMSLLRKALISGSVTTIDDLTYSYKNSDYNNQLENISDAVTTNTAGYGYRNFTGTGSSTPYDYDDNGNLKTDLKKGATITYNELGKPVTITKTGAFGNSIIEYRYDAAGTRISKYVTNNTSSITRLKNTEYIGGYVIEDEILKYYSMAEGRVRNDGAGYGLVLKMEYFIADQQGNTRVSFEDDGTSTNTAVLKQENSYYAFGMQMAGGYAPTTTPPNKKLYNAGSEWQDDIDGLADYYSTFFREYDPVIGRFNGVDPMGVSLESWTTYQYSYNNPINFNDPMGDYAAGRSLQPFAQQMRNDYNSWHDSKYGNNFFDRGWDFGGGGDGGGGGGGGGGMTEFDYLSTYSGTKMSLNDFGSDVKHGFNAFGDFGYWTSESREYNGDLEKSYGTTFGEERSIQGVGVVNDHKVWVSLNSDWQDLDKKTLFGIVKGLYPGENSTGRLQNLTGYLFESLFDNYLSHSISGNFMVAKNPLKVPSEIGNTIPDYFGFYVGSTGIVPNKMGLSSFYELETFYELKATQNNIGLSSFDNQLKKQILAAKSMKVQEIIMITTSDVNLSLPLRNFATENGVRLTHQVAQYRISNSGFETNYRRKTY